jgi:hypothetical protein
MQVVEIEPIVPMRTRNDEAAFSFFTVPEPRGFVKKIIAQQNIIPLCQEISMISPNCLV